MKGSDPKLHRIGVRLLTYQLRLPLDPIGKHSGESSSAFISFYFCNLRATMGNRSAFKNKQQNKTKNKKQVAFPGKSQLQQSRTNQP